MIDKTSVTDGAIGIIALIASVCSVPWLWDLFPRAWDGNWRLLLLVVLLFVEWMSWYVSLPVAFRVVGKVFRRVEDWSKRS